MNTDLWVDGVRLIMSFNPAKKSRARYDGIRSISTRPEIALAGHFACV